jgi:antirestriction protein ArdC
MKEKTLQEKNAAERQVELLTTALDNAKANNGYWMNIAGKRTPQFYPKGCAVSPFNALIMALHSDQNGFKTNLYTLFNEAKMRGESVREHERGVPFNWYAWNQYVNRNNPDDIIPRKDYLELSKEQKNQYKGVHNREIRVLFNIDQTLLPLVDEKKYQEEVLAFDNNNRFGRADYELGQRGAINAFKDKMNENLTPLRRDGSGVAHYDSGKDALYMPNQNNFENYSDYVRELMRQVVSATGNQQRLSREGMVMKNGKAPSEDATKQERLIVEIASGLKMMEYGMQARLSDESLGMVDYWNRELKENPCLIDAVESDVNNALEIIHKAENGEKIEYSSYRNQQETEEMKSQLPKHYFVADEIKVHPNADTKMIVLVRDKDTKNVDVVLPAGASLEVNNEVPGMSKSRIKTALEKEGFETVKFFNADGSLGYRPDDSYFDKKDVTIARLRNWNIEDISRLDVNDAVKQAKLIGFDRIQMVQDDNKRWAMYIKPEGKESFSIYPDKADLNRFFTTLKQAQDNLDSLRVELAQKYYALSEVKPDLKVDLFGTSEKDVDMDRIEKVNVFRAKNDVILCAATIKGEEKIAPRVVSPSQWQRMWIADDKTEYKKHLAATLFADILRKGQTMEENTAEKESKETEQKQTEHAVQKQSEETKKEQKQQEEKPQDKETTLKRWTELKLKHPEALLLFHVAKQYEAYKEDAKNAAKVLGLDAKTIQTTSKQSLDIISFPEFKLDDYLPKLIRNNFRVAICDEVREAKQEAKVDKPDVEKEDEVRSNRIRR